MGKYLYSEECEDPSEAGQQRVDLPFHGQFRVLILHEDNPSKKCNNVSDLR